ncbi:glycosyltransferase family 39 protein [Oculatella sp. LEGE 06141]|uniref:ArnT family glycosyltransferase n=1 Tax=Oculatella sp. LEGE 06141 TaxID=1828648 RepID=UPI00187F3B67|nr:glycosyltransferase family 39 protein [Oculatella sp. LEGE 06141]MBE9177766.1 glycosyltransferase family 39 protein [Oculatella sp. LEGE 06141]
MRWLKANLPYALAAIGFACIALLLTHAYQILEFDTDEGINLMKALLYSQGFSLYTEIWNDQPPLFTVLLAGWFNLVGQSVFSGRLLVVLFSIVLLWSFYQIIVVTLGKTPARVSTFLLVISWLYIRLSVSVMIGLPSLSVALLSLYLLILYQQRRDRRFLIMSAVLLALSLHIKLITAFFVPIFVLYLGSSNGFLYRAASGDELSGKTSVKSSDLIQPILLWIFSISITYGLVGLVLNSFYPEQIVQIHFGERAKVVVQNYADLRYLLTLLGQDANYVWLGVLGGIAAGVLRQREGLLPIAWFTIAFLLLATHNPVWYHHYLFLSVPLVWLSAYAIAIAVPFFRQKSWRLHQSWKQMSKLGFSGLVGVFVILTVVGTPDRLTRPINDVPIDDRRVAELVGQYRHQTHWVLTDRPVYAFAAGLPVPPEIAVMSRKRFNSGALTFDDLLTVLQTYQPEQIVLAKYINRIKAYDPLRKYINQNYVKTYRNKDNQIEHYLSKTIAAPLNELP